MRTHDTYFLLFCCARVPCVRLPAGHRRQNSGPRSGSGGSASSRALPASLTSASRRRPGTSASSRRRNWRGSRRRTASRCPNPPRACFEIPMRRWRRSSIASHARLAARRSEVERSWRLPTAECPGGRTGISASPVSSRLPQSRRQLWRGYVKYAGTRGRRSGRGCRLLQKMEAVVAGKDLPPNVPIDAASLRLETGRAAAVAGTGRGPARRCARAGSEEARKAGSLIPLALLEDAPAVRRGEAVRVEVHSGPARCCSVRLRKRPRATARWWNCEIPSTGKTFRARLERFESRGRDSVGRRCEDRLLSARWLASSAQAGILPSVAKKKAKAARTHAARAIHPERFGRRGARKAGSHARRHLVAFRAPERPRPRPARQPGG